MKRFSIISMALASLFAVSAAQAQSPLTGTVQGFVSKANVDSGYADSNIQGVSALFNVNSGDKLGVNLTNIDAWGGQAVVGGVRYVKKMDAWGFIDGSLAVSNHDKISIQSQMSVMVNAYALEKNNLVVGVGASRYKMRGGAPANQLAAQAVYYFEGMPLVAQGNITYSQSEFNEKAGTNAGVAVTYGRVGQWTANARYSGGRVNYELLKFPGAVADYHSTSYGVGANYWLDKKSGVTVGVSKVTNRYFNRDEVTLGYFADF